jgi:hypothetical protein
MISRKLSNAAVVGQAATAPTPKAGTVNLESGIGEPSR